MSLEPPEYISPQLLQAYRETRYRVPAISVTIQIGQHTPELDRLLENHPTKSWAFISASNPRSHPASEHNNQKRHKELVNACEPYQIFEALGEPCDQSWKAEISLLVLGIDQRNALLLCQQFDQNAVVFAEAGKRARLLFNSF